MGEGQCRIGLQKGTGKCFYVLSMSRILYVTPGFNTISLKLKSTAIIVLLACDKSKL